MNYKILLAISLVLLLIHIYVQIKGRKVLRRKKNLSEKKYIRKLELLYSKLYNKIRNVFCKKEILILQTYTILLIKSGLNAKEILYNLSKRTRFFAYEIDEALTVFTTDNKKALRQLRDATKSNVEFEKVVIAIEQCLLADRDTSLIFLTNSRNITKELYKLKKIRNDGKKRILTTLMLALPLAACILVAGYPWFDYVIKLISDVPI